MSETPFSIIPPTAEEVPFLLSLPHSGTEFPAEIRDKYFPDLVEILDDTDWFLEKLYDFAPGLGITTIAARYSRWVIDLNREPNSRPLYTDGRLITELCPTTTFLGERIYRKKGFEPDDREIGRRLEQFYYPYHQKIDQLLSELKSEFGRVIFWDGHSIRRAVPTIRKEPFPDFILGTNDAWTAGEEFIQTALGSLRSGIWQINHNDPFKGGFLTRSKGDPAKDVHALQLEMSKDLYMSNDELKYAPARAEKVKRLLKKTFEQMISRL